MAIDRPFSESDWLATPQPVRRYVESLEQRIEQLETTVALLVKRIEQLESRLNENSQHSSKPPSSDPPYQRAERGSKKSKRRRSGQKGHVGHRQQLLDPSEIMIVHPGRCAYGCERRRAGSLRSFYTHQWIELPEIRMQVKHVVLQKAQCSGCQRWVRAALPREYQTGYGPRFSAMVAELSGIQGISRQAVEAFVQDLFGVPISTGGIQKVVDRASAALAPVHAGIGALVRGAAVNHVDETSWQQAGALRWLWTMTNAQEAFAHSPPGKRKWTGFYLRLMLLLLFFEGAEDDAGKLAREVLREIDGLWVFLDAAGVGPPTTAPSGHYALPCSGASAPTAPRARRATVGWSGC
jgi:transposase